MFSMHKQPSTSSDENVFTKRAVNLQESNFIENHTSARAFSCSEHLFIRTPTKGCFWVSIIQDGMSFLSQIIPFLRTMKPFLNRQWFNGGFIATCNDYNFQ